ncbi:MAG: MFS transporter [Candidatus Helarchaeota archaeon]|nr:MFS transporter [Candidatus Helarchaeota archaeon]
MNESHRELQDEGKDISAMRNLNILSFAAFVRMLGVGLVNLILAIYALELVGDVFLSGIAVGAFSITQVVFQIPIAKLSDRIGRKNTLLIGMGIFATGTLLCGVSQTIYQLIIFRLIQGSGAYISVIQALLGDLFPSEKRGRAMGRYIAAMTVGYAVGLPLGGIFVDIPNYAFFLHFGVILISMALIYFFINESPISRVKKQEVKINYRQEIFKNRLFLFTVLVDCLSIFVFASLLAYIALFALSLGIEASIFSIFMIPLVLLMTLGFFLGGKYSDQIGRSKMILIGFSVAGPLILVQSIITTPVQLVIIAGILVFGLGLAWPTLQALIIDSVSEPCRATGTSVYNTFRYTSNALGPIIMAYIIGVYSPSPENIGPGIRVSYLISGIIYIIAFFLVLIFLRRFEKERHQVC